MSNGQRGQTRDAKPTPDAPHWCHVISTFDISSVDGLVQTQNVAVSPDARDARRSVSRVLSRPSGEPLMRGWPFIWGARHRTPRATDPSGGAAGPPGGAGLSRRRPPLLLGLAPGGVCPAAAVAGGAVRSYRTISPLPPMPSQAGRAGARRCVSVALSLGSPPPGVTRHRASVEPGLSSLCPSREAWTKSGHPTVWHWEDVGMRTRPVKARIAEHSGTQRSSSPCCCSPAGRAGRWSTATASASPTGPARRSPRRRTSAMKRRVAAALSPRR